MRVNLVGSFFDTDDILFVENITELNSEYGHYFFFEIRFKDHRAFSHKIFSYIVENHAEWFRLSESDRIEKGNKAKAEITKLFTDLQDAWSYQCSMHTIERS